MAVNAISGFNLVSPSIFGKAAGVSDTESVSKSFGEFFNEALNKVNDLQLESERITDDFAAGRTDNIHQVMIAAEKADVALQFTMQVRNKIMDAYNEIMRIQI
jgi:flagellar hook-basal body complex protein FliE